MKVHKILVSPTKKEFMDISNSSDPADDLDKDNSFILEHARDLNRKDDAEELEIMLGMRSQVNFDASVLTAPSPDAEPAKDKGNLREIKGTCKNFFLAVRGCHNQNP